MTTGGGCDKRRGVRGLKIGCLEEKNRSERVPKARGSYSDIIALKTFTVCLPEVQWTIDEGAAGRAVDHLGQEHWVEVGFSGRSIRSDGLSKKEANTYASETSSSRGPWCYRSSSKM